MPVAQVLTHQVAETGIPRGDIGEHVPKVHVGRVFAPAFLIGVDHALHLARTLGFFPRLVIDHGRAGVRTAAQHPHGGRAAGRRQRRIGRAQILGPERSLGRIGLAGAAACGGQHILIVGTRHRVRHHGAKTDGAQYGAEPFSGNHKRQGNCACHQQSDEEFAWPFQEKQKDGKQGLALITFKKIASHIIPLALVREPYGAGTIPAPTGFIYPAYRLNPYKGWLPTGHTWR